MNLPLNTALALGGMAVGAGLMYLLDPHRGPQRRRRLRRQAVRAGRRGVELAQDARRMAAAPARLFA